MMFLLCGVLLAGIVAPAFVRGAASGCPPACVAGGGTPATDCFLQFGRISSTSVSCADGDPTCDSDATVNGVCLIPLSVCLNAPGSGCTTTALSRPASVKPTKDASVVALASALGQLSLTDVGCTAVPVAVKLKVGLTGLKPGVTKLTFKATAGGKTDKDKLVLTCTPGAAPSLGTTMQPVFTATCALSGCHDVTNIGNLNMEAGNSYAEIVGVAAESSLAKGAKIVEPRNIKKSYLARKILGQGLAQFDTPMPSGCPVLGPCLTEEEKVQILTWIQAGAPNN